MTLNDHFPYIYQDGHWISTEEPESPMLRNCVELAKGMLLAACAIVLLIISFCL